MKKKMKVLLFGIGMAISMLMRGIQYNNNNMKIKKGEIIELGEEEEIRGPESFAFDGDGEGPYTTISDGSVIKLENKNNKTTWLHFASSSTHTHCNRREREREAICGRPLGICFNKSNGYLYVADAYFGLLLLASEGGQPTTVATDAEGIPFMFTNGLDIDLSNDVVYFTDSSSRYQRRNYIYVILSGDKSGRLMKYDPKRKKVTVLLRNLSFPNGVALSEDGTFILIAETSQCRILKYWIHTSKIEVFTELPGFPDNIKRSPRGGYWVGIHSKRDKLAKWLLSYPWIGTSLIKLPLDFMRLYSMLSMFRGSGMGIRLNDDGQILEVFEDRNKFKSISEIMEKDGHLWIGSINSPFVGKYQVTT